MNECPCLSLALGGGNFGARKCIGEGESGVRYTSSFFLKSNIIIVNNQQSSR